MLAIGRALMAEPKILLLDEPSLGLAPLMVEQIRDIIVQVNGQGTSVLLVEQNATMALSIADAGYVLEHGRIVKDGPGKVLLEDKDIREFYLGMGEVGRRSFRDVKTYRRKKSWRRPDARRAPLLEVRDLTLRFGGVSALDAASASTSTPASCSR